MRGAPKSLQPASEAVLTRRGTQGWGPGRARRARATGAGPWSHALPVHQAVNRLRARLAARASRRSGESRCAARRSLRPGLQTTRCLSRGVTRPGARAGKSRQLPLLPARCTDTGTSYYPTSTPVQPSVSRVMVPLCLMALSPRSSPNERSFPVSAHPCAPFRSEEHGLPPTGAQGPRPGGGRSSTVGHAGIGLLLSLTSFSGSWLGASRGCVGR